MLALSHEPAERDSAPEARKTTEQLILHINNYCARCWKQAGLPFDTWGDATQDVLLRILKTVDKNNWPLFFDQGSEEHKEFARAIDAVKHRVLRAHRCISLSRGAQSADDGEDFSIDPPDTHADKNEDWEEIAALAERYLPPIDYNILRLYHDGFEQHEIAVELHISEGTVSRRKQICIKKLYDLMQYRKTA